MHVASCQLPSVLWSPCSVWHGRWPTLCLRLVRVRVTVIQIKSNDRVVTRSMSQVQDVCIDSPL